MPTSPPLTLLIRNDPDGTQHLSMLHDDCEVPVLDTPQLKQFMASVRQAIDSKEQIATGCPENKIAPNF